MSLGKETIVSNNKYSWWERFLISGIEKAYKKKFFIDREGYIDSLEEQIIQAERSIVIMEENFEPEIFGSNQIVSALSNAESRGVKISLIGSTPPDQHNVEIIKMQRRGNLDFYPLEDMPANFISMADGTSFIHGDIPQVGCENQREGIYHLDTMFISSAWGRTLRAIIDSKEPVNL